MVAQDYQGDKPANAGPFASMGAWWNGVLSKLGFGGDGGTSDALFGAGSFSGKKYLLITWIFLIYIVAFCVSFVAISIVQIAQEVDSQSKGSRGSPTFARVVSEWEDRNSAMQALSLMVKSQSELRHHARMIGVSEDQYLGVGTESQAPIPAEAVVTRTNILNQRDLAFSHLARWSLVFGFACELQTVDDCIKRLTAAVAIRKYSEDDKPAPTEAGGQGTSVPLPEGAALISKPRTQEVQAEKVSQVVQLAHLVFLSILPQVPVAVVLLVLVMTMGIIGSTMHVTVVSLEILSGKPETRPLMWYLFRPVLGGISALALYVLFRSGQMVIVQGGDVENVSPFLPCFIGLVGGILSTRTYDTIIRVGERWLSGEPKPNLWAFGLKEALERQGLSPAEMAVYLTVREETMKAWIEEAEQVPFEYQSRIAAYLRLEERDIFTTMPPRQPVDNSSAPLDRP